LPVEMRLQENQCMNSSAWPLHEASDREKSVLDAVIKAIVRHLGPLSIVLFGSRGKGLSRKGSDFDLALDAAKPPASLERAMRDEIERVSGLYSVDVVYLKSVEEPFRRLVLKTGVVVYER
jgi:predicted nucleotidyltransferase